MKSIIEDIYYGKRGFVETIKASKEYWKVHEEFGKIYEKLESQLTDEQKNILNELYLAMGGLESEQCITNFKEGVKIGLLIAIEALI